MFLYINVIKAIDKWYYLLKNDQKSWALTIDCQSYSTDILGINISLFAIFKILLLEKEALNSGGKIGLDKKIFLVEDDPEIRNFIKLYLTKDGYEVIEVERGDLALEVFAHENPDLVMLDILLPGLDGIEVCREIRKTSIVPSHHIKQQNRRNGQNHRPYRQHRAITSPKPFSPRE